MQRITGFEVLGTYLMAATYMDLQREKVPNLFILMGYATGVYVQIQQMGPKGILHVLVNALWPIVLLYFLFLIRAVGAGDIKLISVMSTFLEPAATIQVVITSIFIGGIISIFKILKNKKQRVGGILQILGMHRPRSYIHYTVPIMGAYIIIIWFGG